MPTLLVVEDDLPNRTLLSLQLEDLGCLVLTADNGAQGLDICRTGRPAAVVLDLNMPTLDGFGFLRQLRASDFGKSMPVVVVTAMMLDQERMNQLRQAGVTKVFEKGRYDEDDLLGAVRSAMGAA